MIAADATDYTKLRKMPKLGCLKWDAAMRMKGTLAAPVPTSVLPLFFPIHLPSQLVLCAHLQIKSVSILVQFLTTSLSHPTFLPHPRSQLRASTNHGCWKEPELLLLSQVQVHAFLGRPTSLLDDGPISKLWRKAWNDDTSKGL